MSVTAGQGAPKTPVLGTTNHGSGSTGSPKGGVTGKTHAQYVAQQIGSMTALLRSWNLDPAKFKGLMNSAANGNWNSDMFQAAVTKSSIFHKAYPGIFNQHGGLKMTPQAYMAQVAKYQSVAEKANVNFSHKQAMLMMRNGVSVQEFGDRVKAYGVLKSNQQLFDDFNAELKSKGLAPMKAAQQVKYIMGLGNEQYYQVWNAASTRAMGQAANSQITNAQYQISNAQFESIAQRAVDGQGTFNTGAVQKGMQTYQQLVSQLDPAKAGAMGITQQNLVDYAFGGPSQSSTASRIQQYARNTQAFDSQQAQASAQALGGRAGALRQ